jgi:hypothetical protein
MDIFSEIYNDYKKQRKILDDSVSYLLPPVLILVGRYDRRYVVASLDFKNCVRSDHLSFSAYYKTDEMPNDKTFSYTVALPLSLYEGFELHPYLPKTIRGEYKDKDFGFLPKNIK